MITPSRKEPQPAGCSEGDELLDLASQLLAPARILLERFGAPLLTVAVGREHIQVAPWTSDLAIRPEISDALAARHGVARALNEARVFGGAVCVLLAKRWPPNSAPPIIGVVTDGVGLAISGGHPCALTADWLIDHVAGRATVDMILPFGGAAARLIEPAARRARHH